MSARTPIAPTLVAGAESSNPQARKRRKIRKLVLNAENLVRLLSQNNGKMQAKVLLRQFKNITKQKDLFKQLRVRYCEIEKVERTKPDGKKETLNFFVLKKWKSCRCIITDNVHPKDTGIRCSVGHFMHRDQLEKYVRTTCEPHADRVDYDILLKQRKRGVLQENGALVCPSLV